MATVVNSPGALPRCVSPSLRAPALALADRLSIALPSGLLPLTVTVTGSPGFTVAGLAEQESTGGLGCFTVNDEEHVATLFFFFFGSVTVDLIVYWPGAICSVFTVAEAPCPAAVPPLDSQP